MAICKRYLLSRSVVLDELAILEPEAGSHPVNLLVDLSPVVVALLASSARKRNR